MHDGYEQLFVREPQNPILKASDWPYPIHSVFNPGATRLQDGTTLLLCRCEDRRGISHLTAARSADGVTDWQIDPSPTFAPDPANHAEELWGIEDPRITFVPDLGKYVIAYTAYSKTGPGVALATTEDFKTFERLGLVMQPDDKDAALLPRLFDDQFVLIHRPTTEQGSHMWISQSPDLRNWGGHRQMLPARLGAWWDANKIGLSPPPIETPRGWIVMYHGVRRHASGAIYRLGLALFDLERPEVCLLRGETWMMAPVERYEIEGDVPYVVFPCGYTVGDDGDTVNLYYGAADTCIGLARGSIGQLLEWLDRNGTHMVGVAGTEVESRELTTEP
ncbi:MAG: hypothetical protein KF733_04420 [Fimbriimonadaceae bacterium]|nr:MAG: hypothetical protein KF733_04420 [Fimbriimonadaceae bacterium]